MNASERTELEINLRSLVAARADVAVLREATYLSSLLGVDSGQSDDEYRVAFYERVCPIR